MHACPVDSCGRKFPRASNLDRHMASHRTPLQRSSCDQCGKSLKNENSLKRHRSRCKHEAATDEVRIFNCVYCEKSFASFDLFEGHILQEISSDSRALLYSQVFWMKISNIRSLLLTKAIISLLTWPSSKPGEIRFKMHSMLLTVLVPFRQPERRIRYWSAAGHAKQCQKIASSIPLVTLLMKTVGHLAVNHHLKWTKRELLGCSWPALETAQYLLDISSSIQGMILLILKSFGICVFLLLFEDRSRCSYWIVLMKNPLFAHSTALFETGTSEKTMFWCDRAWMF